MAKATDVIYRFHNFLKAACLHPGLVKRLWKHAERDSLEFLLFGPDLDDQPAPEILEASETYVRSLVEAKVWPDIDQDSLAEGVLLLLGNLSRDGLMSPSKAEEVCGLLGPKHLEVFKERREPSNLIKAQLVEVRMRAAAEIAADLTDIPSTCTDPMSCTMRTVILRDHGVSSLLHFTPIKSCDCWCSENPNGKGLKLPRREEIKPIELAECSDPDPNATWGIRRC